MALITGAEGERIYLLSPANHKESITVIDMISGMWNVGVGHSFSLPKYSNDFSAPLIKYDLKERDQLAKRLSELFGYPGVMLFRTGSEVTDAAVRVAMALTRKDKMLALEGGYHGCTGFASMASRGFNNRGLNKSLRELCDGGTVGHWAMADVVDCSVMERELAKIQWSELTAFIFEPVQGSAGGAAINPTAYEAIATKCRENGVFIIADEIMTGIGRCGYLALTETYATKPDMLLLGKMLGNEQGIAALLLCQDIVDKQSRIHRTGFYATTTGGNRIGCQTALRVLGEVTFPGFLEEIRDRSQHLKQFFREIFEEHPGVQSIQAHGLFFVVKTTSEDLAMSVHMDLLTKDGFSVDLSGSKLRFCPPLRMSRTQIELAFTATANRLREHK